MTGWDLYWMTRLDAAKAWLHHLTEQATEKEEKK